MIAGIHIRTWAIPSAVLLIAGVQAPAAGADPEAFYNDVMSIGVKSSTGEEGVVNTGKAICSALGRGLSADTVATQLFYNSAVANNNDGITLEQARQEVTFAINDLCPP